jgi:hypothetical protein
MLLDLLILIIFCYEYKGKRPLERPRYRWMGSECILGRFEARIGFDWHRIGNGGEML